MSDFSEELILTWCSKEKHVAKYQDLIYLGKKLFNELWVVCRMSLMKNYQNKMRENMMEYEWFVQKRVTLIVAVLLTRRLCPCQSFENTASLRILSTMMLEEAW